MSSFHTLIQFGFWVSFPSQPYRKANVSYPVERSDKSRPIKRLAYKTESQKEF